MGLTTEKCELYPDTVITFGLFEDVENCAELQEKSKEEAIKVALINPKMVKLARFVCVCETDRQTLSGMGECGGCSPDTIECHYGIFRQSERLQPCTSWVH